MALDQENYNPNANCFQTNVLNLDSNESAIEKLTDDCLINIFEYLPIIDRVRSEAVCKRWRSLIDISWRSFKHLTFCENAWTHSKVRYVSEEVITINDKIFKSLMIRFGRYLISVDLSCEFSLIQHQLSPDCIEQIVQSCSKLQALNMGKMFQTVAKCQGKTVEADDCECESGLSKILQTLKNWKRISSLKKFGVEVLHVKADNLSALISKMKNLESLYMAFEVYYFIEGSYLSGLPFSSLREVILEDTGAIKTAVIVETIQKIPQLDTMVLMEMLDYSVLFHLLPPQSESLKNLALGLAHNREMENLRREIRMFHSFINLERLNLMDNVALVKDNFLQTMSRYCRQLTFLNICGNTHVTDNGMQYVVCLSQLQYLFMHNLCNVKGKTLRKMDSLEVLGCYDCASLEDEGLCAIVRQSKLRLLDVGKCKKVTNKLLDSVVEEASSREKKLDMLLAISDTDIDVSRVEKIPPLLRVTGSYEFPYCAFNKVNTFFPTMGPFGATTIDITSASEIVWRCSDGRDSDPNIVYGIEN